MSSGGDETQTVYQNSDPWEPAAGSLQRVLNNASTGFNNEIFAPQTYTSATGNSTYAGLSGDSTQALARMSAMAGDAGLSGGLADSYASMSNIANGGTSAEMQHAMTGLSDVMRNGPVTTYRSMTDSFNSARDAALADAIPAATQMFSGSGMANSSMAEDGIARAAMDAVAPMHYQATQASLDRDIAAQENALNRNISAAGAMGSLADSNTTQALRAGALVPSAYSAQFAPAQMQAQVGSALDGHAQNVTDAAVSNYYENANRAANNLSGYASTVLPVSGQGGTGSTTQTTPGASFGERAGSSILGGLGTYGALAANPVTAPFALLGGVGTGLMGLF